MTRSRLFGAVSFIFVLGLTVVVFQNCTSGADPNMGSGGGSSPTSAYDYSGSGAATTTTGTATFTPATGTGAGAGTGTGTDTTTTTTGSGSGTGTMVTEMKGNLDSANLESGGAVIRGWACLATTTQSVTVKIYVNRPKGQYGSYFIQAVNTYISDSTASSNCGVVGGTLRFESRWLNSTTFAYKNLNLYLYAVDPRNGTDVQIMNGNGQFKVPIP